jgi:4-hydroxybenzoate polyprenyltransferase
MMQSPLLLRFFYWIVFGNYWVSAGLVALYAVTCNALGFAFSWVWAAALFFATLAVYTYHRVGLGKLRPAAALFEGVRRNWIISNLKMLRIQMVLAAIVSLVLFSIVCSDNQLIFIVPAAIVSLLYIMPIFPHKGHWIRLREIPYIKIFLIAGIWFMLSILPILIDFKQIITNKQFQLLLLQRLLFLFAIIIPFDLRDIEFDRKQGIRTLATALGAKSSLRVSHGLLIVSAIVCWMAYQMHFFSGSTAIGLAVSAASTAAMLTYIKPDSDEMMFSFWLEGSLLDQLFWVQMFS